MFDTPTLAEGGWHHVAVTWNQDSGRTRAYVDGDEVLPVADVDPSMARGTSRSSTGSVALGQDQARQTRRANYACARWHA